LDNDLETASNHDGKNDSNIKRTLRDHSKKKTQDHLENKLNNHNPAPTTSSKTSKPTNEGVKKYLNLIQKLKKHPKSDPFLEPVDVVGLGLDDYYTIVKEPMDLSTVENKLKNEEYANANQLIADIRKIWSNAQLYNKKGNLVHQMAVELSGYFEKNLKEMGDVSFNDTVKDLEKKVERLSKQITELHNKNTKGHSNSKNKSSSAQDKGLTRDEKKILCQNIKRLPAEHLRGVWEIVSEGLNQKSNTKEVLEFDIESLPVKVTRELDKYVKLKMSSTNTSHNKSKNKTKEPTVVQTIVKSQRLPEGVPVPNTGGYHGIPIQNSQHIPYNSNSQQVYYTQPEPVQQAAHVNDDKSSESSFISDSDSDNDLEPTHKKFVQ